MAPVVAEIALENKNTFIVAKLNSLENPKTSQKYQLHRVGHPAYLIFQDGEEVGQRFRGVKTKAKLLEEILSVIKVEEN